MNSISFHHPYGAVGALEWQSSTSSVQFGAEPSTWQLVELSQNVKTFSEGVDPASSDVETVRAAVRNADLLLFLGFAFHPMNMDYILPPLTVTGSSSDPMCLGTALGISESDREVITRQILEMLPHLSRIALRPDLTCAGLFQEYRRTLASR